MAYYIVNVNKDDNGKHEVHETTCQHLPHYTNQHALGYHADCESALRAAETAGYAPADGCWHCSRPCHTG